MPARIEPAKARSQTQATSLISLHTATVQSPILPTKKVACARGALTDVIREDWKANSSMTKQSKDLRQQQHTVSPVRTLLTDSLLVNIINANKRFRGVRLTW